MANFSDFVKMENSNANVHNNEVNKDQLEKMIDDYSKLSENDLMKEFIKLTLEKKKNGTLNDDELENIKNTIIPFLNEDQKNNLNKLLNMVKYVWKDR